MNRIEWRTDDAEKALDVLTGSVEWRESPDALQIRSRMIRALFAAVDVAMERETRTSPPPAWLEAGSDWVRQSRQSFYSQDPSAVSRPDLDNYYIDDLGNIRDRRTKKIVPGPDLMKTSVPPVKPAKPKIEVPDAAQRQLIWDEDEEH